MVKEKVSNPADGSLKPVTTVLVYVGKPVTLTAKVQDKNNFTEGIDQTIVWDLQKVNSAAEIDVNDYATLNGNVLTPKTNSVDKIKVVGVSELLIRICVS